MLHVSVNVVKNVRYKLYMVLTAVPEYDYGGRL